jgi:hypothetical protein
MISAFMIIPDSSGNWKIMLLAFFFAFSIQATGMLLIHKISKLGLLTVWPANLVS